MISVWSGFCAEANTNYARGDVLHTEKTGSVPNSLFHNIFIHRDDAFEPDMAFDCVQHADSYVEEDTRSRMT